MGDVISLLRARRRFRSRIQRRQWFPRDGHRATLIRFPARIRERPAKQIGTQCVGLPLPDLGKRLVFEPVRHRRFAHMEEFRQLAVEVEAKGGSYFTFGHFHD